MKFKEHEPFSDIFAIEDFRRYYLQGELVSGFGYFATETRVSNEMVRTTDLNWRPIWATHVVWYKT